MVFELSNEQRAYFGLEPVLPHWEKVVLKGDAYRSESILYFEGDVIKRQIVSTDLKYEEHQYDDLTRGRIVLLPKTGKGKEKKLSASVLESRQPVGVYCIIGSDGSTIVGNYDTQTTFYNARWEYPFKKDTLAQSIERLVNGFIKNSPLNHLTEIAEFKHARRKHQKFKTGDFFAFKISRTQYAFGRVLVDINLLKKRNVLSEEHGIGFLMAKPVLVKVYAYLSDHKYIDIDVLKNAPALPSDYMMDNLLLYGQYEVIGHSELTPDEMDFPMSYGSHVSSGRLTSFLQWGLIHKELPKSVFNKYFAADNPFAPKDRPSCPVTNPYGYYSIGFHPHNCYLYQIEAAIENNNQPYNNQQADFKSHFDLRNPSNKEIRDELMTAFGLDPAKNYDDNCRLTNTPTSQALLNL
ncbi:immunity 26/phosphotriesterase HocA family protein [Mucilaginibacter pedocola]|uniref:Immunity protein 26 n=1 Tax=Mucilaginibacter pedocola TaxID=1792845 RepID=A0A1S9P8M9_9SPHI|nr:immunity 26/phosphotriesterase HocA family protein [Mucilaginibacter pedocola]OOQ57324.1 hypothetical protein BC343_14530 [Mucilaginibacter pedocola]